MKKQNLQADKKRKKKTFKKKGAFLAIAIGLFVIMMVAAVEFTSHSNFCAACHYMKPFFKSWEESSHSKFECNVCHYPPGGGITSRLRKKVEGLVMVGRYWTKLYMKSKPWAEIRDESCLRKGCHEKRLLEGEVQFNNVAFDHKVHFSDLKRGKLLQCTSCHSQIVQGEHITVTESSCFICHFKKSEHYPQIDNCSHCHKRSHLINEKTSRFNHALVFDNGFNCDKCHSSVIVGDGEVPKENCYKCHWERERLEKYSDTDLMHTVHIYKNKIECNQCHMEIQHKIIKDIESIADCKTCHTDFHEAQKILYAGNGGKGVAHAMPNIMLEKGLSCKGCHMFHEESGGKIFKSDTSISRPKACESCHGKGFSRILKNWETSTRKKLNQVKAIYNKASHEIKQSPKKENEAARSLLEEAIFNIELVEKGKSVHNVSFSQELLLAAYNKILEALKSIKSPYHPEKFSGAEDVIPTQCSNCHAGIEEITAEIFGLNFPHKKHLIEQKIDCSNCHSNIRKHGEFIATKQGCAACHHRNLNKNCTTCHRLQSLFYKGGNKNGFDIPEDMMSEAGVECTDCHLEEQTRIIRSSKTKCVDCHEGDYADLYSKWQNTTKENMTALAKLLNETQKLNLSSQEKTEISQTRRLLQNIKLDASSGVHNSTFIEESLSTFKKKLESLLNEQKEKQ